MGLVWEATVPLETDSADVQALLALQAGALADAIAHIGLADCEAASTAGPPRSGLCRSGPSAHWCGCHRNSRLGTAGRWCTCRVSYNSPATSASASCI